MKVETESILLELKAGAYVLDYEVEGKVVSGYTVYGNLVYMDRVLLITYAKSRLLQEGYSFAVDYTVAVKNTTDRPSV